MVNSFKKILSIMLFVVLGLFSCGKKVDETYKNTNNKVETTIYQKQNNIDKTFNIAVIEYFDSDMDHNAYHGFFDYLNNNNVKYNLVYDYLAKGDDENLKNSIERLYYDELEKEDNKIDLFYCIGNEAVSTIRSFFFEDGTIATNLVKPDDFVVVNIKNKVKFAAVKTMPPYERQLKLLEKYKDSATSVGILYTNYEKESVYQMELSKEYLENNNYKVKTYEINSETNYNELAKSIKEEVDAVYVVVDRYLLGESKKIFESLNKEDIFSVGANHYYVDNGASITLAIDYYKAGEEAGKMAYEYLVEGYPIEKLLIRDLDLYSNSVYENKNINN